VAETHWGRKLNLPWRAHLLARRVESEKKSIKGLSNRSKRGYHIIRDILCHFRKRENRGKHRENLKRKEHKD